MIHGQLTTELEIPKLRGHMTSALISYQKDFCGETPCFDAVTDIYVSSVSESGAALQVTMKGFKNGSAKTVTKSGRNIKSQLGFTSHYFKTSSQSDVSNLNIGPITANNTSTAAVENSSSSTGDTPQYATSSSGLNYLSKAGLLNVCNETSSACQAKTISREEAAAVVSVVVESLLMHQMHIVMMIKVFTNKQQMPCLIMECKFVLVAHFKFNHQKLFLEMNLLVYLLVHKS